jgi:3-hydroxyisobutyrate dehydrogenase-like beta-hydroxyacid dehydrogenase
MRVAFVGLGTMGAAMAGHLLDAGHDVAVHNRTREREEPLAERGARRAATPKEAAEGAELVFVCVSDSPDVEHVVLGDDGIVNGLSEGAVLVDCSTIAPATSRTLADELAKKGCGAVDAPVSGGSEGAQKGILTTFLGGEDAHVEKARPGLEAFCKSITHLGGPGAGQVGKAVNQVMLAGTYACLGEGLALAERENLPLEALVQALSGGAARSWVLENRAKNVIADSYPLGFKTELHLKDLRIALEQARAAGLKMEISAAVAGQMERLVESGHGEEDVSSLGRVAKGELD